ncbi:MAG: hypothetical protein ABSE86_36535 [Bryobacteraceae bacterium]
MRVRLKWNDGQQERDLLFQGVPEKALWAPFSFSVCMQTLLVGLAISYLHFIALLPPDSLLEIRRDRVLDLSSDPLEEYRSIVAPNLAADHPATSHQRRAPSARNAQASTEPSPETAPSLPAREFRMPPVRTRRAIQQTLVQMDLPPTMDLHQQLRVPTIVLLASTPRRLAPRPFIAPPQRKNTMEVPSRVVTEMRPPILDIRAGYAKTPEVLRDMTPRLAAPVGAVAPVAGSREPVEAKPAAATVTGTAVDPPNIISLPDRPIPAASAIVLPPLNQISGRDTAAGAGGDGAGAGGTAPSHSGSGVSTASNASGNSPASRAPAAGLGTDHAGNSASVVASGAGTKPAGGVSVSGGGNVAPSKAAAGPARLIRPQNGTYEVAIVQSSGVVPGSSGLLKGKPVYSVYIPVGTGKEWILQYCLPVDDAQPAARSQVVQLGNITPITAPYAFSIIGPTIQFRAGARYAFIHGFVNASGRFEHLTEASDQEIENIAAVLESLGQWEFRPATKDGVPAMVEILLCIPNAA